MTTAEAVQELSDLFYAIAKECGRPIVLTPEDREKVAAILWKVRGVNVDRARWASA